VDRKGQVCPIESIAPRERTARLFFRWFRRGTAIADRSSKPEAYVTTHCLHPARATGAVALAVVLAHAAACTGWLGGADQDPPGASPGASPGAGANGAPGSAITPANPSVVAAPAHIRRLSVTEIKNSMRDVFAVDDSDFPVASFPVEGMPGRFDNQFASLSLSSAFVDALQNAAEWAASKAAARLGSLLACGANPTDETGCAESFVDVYGARVYRRPLADAERATLLDVYTTTRKAEEFPTSIATVIEAMLQSPSFVFRTELGGASAKTVPLTAYETASALSYFLWQSMPDQTLTDAAKSGQLATKGGVRAQAERMLADARATDAAHSMFVQWLGMIGLVQVGKMDPSWDSNLAASMQSEVFTFIDKAVWGQNGYKSLFTSAATYIDANLAAVYGVQPPAAAGLSPVTLDAQTHAGFLTMPGFIAIHTPGQNRSPVQLGKFVRESLFCQAMPPPPPGVPPVPTDPNLDEKKRFDMHDHDPACQGCHSLMDPIGYGWSQYDVIGRLSPNDHGVTEDGAGNITATDVDGAFTGPVALGAKLVSSKEVEDCFAKTVMIWALGRAADPGAEGSSDAQALTAARASGFPDGDMKALFASLVTTDAFLFRDTTLVPQGAKAP
jgi:hypothetical protein